MKRVISSSSSSSSLLSSSTKTDTVDACTTTTITGSCSKKKNLSHQEDDTKKKDTMISFIQQISFQWDPRLNWQVQMTTFKKREEEKEGGKDPLCHAEEKGEAGRPHLFFSNDLISVRDYPEMESYIFFILVEEDEDTKDDRTVDSGEANNDRRIAQFSLVHHEKGWSVKMNDYGIFAVIQTNGVNQVIELTTVKPSSMSLPNTKIRFLKKDYPFSFQYEKNPQCDEIFHDFVGTHLPSIQPSEGTYTVPVKCTSQLISYRQYIGYMKTSTLFQFVIEERGWTLKERAEDHHAISSSSLIQGVDIRIRHEWIFHPWGSRIEHQLIFI